MGGEPPDLLMRALLDRYGKTYAEEAVIGTAAPACRAL